MASSGPAIKLVFDASGIRGFHDSKVGILADILQFFEKTDHKLIMCSENLYECSLALRKDFHASSITEEVKTNPPVLKQVKGICSAKFPVDPYDYNCIAAAVDQGVDFLVSNDFRLIKAASECRAKGLGRFKILNPPSLLTYMCASHRELLDWKTSITDAVKYYNYIEISRIYHGITELNLEEGDIRQMFTPYATHIYDTLKTV